MADRRSEALTLMEAAGLVGAYRWAERRLFELTGAWAAEADDPESQLHLDRLSAEHAWHAELWAARLPVLDGVDPEAVTAPAGALGPLMAALAAVGSTVGRLAGLHRVALPRLLVTYDLHLARAAPVAEGPTIRALRLVRRDESEAWADGEALLQGLVVARGALDDVVAVQRGLEEAVVASGVTQGLVPWPATGP